jgi:NADH:ubiquinone oxidoreductase subunit 3 (subunit A)
MNTLNEFFPVFVFIVVAILFTLMPVAIAYLLSPRTKGNKTFATYECGIEPFGSAWVRYSAHYYIYALIFIAFAVSYTKGAKSYEFWSLLVFMLILGLAIVYAWGKGVFTWKRKVQ